MQPRFKKIQSISHHKMFGIVQYQNDIDDDSGGGDNGDDMGDATYTIIE